MPISSNGEYGKASRWKERMVSVDGPLAIFCPFSFVAGFNRHKNWVLDVDEGPTVCHRLLKLLRCRFVYLS